MFCLCPPFHVAEKQKGNPEQKGVFITNEILSRMLGLPVLKVDFWGLFGKVFTDAISLSISSFIPLFVSLMGKLTLGSC